MDIKDIQRALKRQDFDPGEIDGLWGRRSIAAVKAFQKARGLAVDGIVGPETLRALNPTAAPASNDNAPLVWLEEALALVGTTEQAGPGSNQKIIQWAKGLNIDYKDDDIPWCGLFIAHCVGSTLPDEHLPNAPLLARSWQRFGDPSTPVRGAVLVFWRGDKNGVQGHVGFYHSEDDDAYHVLGGNQSNAVNMCRVAKTRLLQARWPHTAATIRGAVLIAAASEGLSHNEA